MLQFLESVQALVWGWPTLTMLVGVGVLLSVRLNGLPVRKLPRTFRLLLSDDRKQRGDISPFQALMTALSATIGTGNIAGVATAIVLGGPGAIFWMWVTALVGMATKYSEAVLAVHFRTRDPHGNHHGGPMYYIRAGLGPRFYWLASVFALFGTLAAFGIGNMVQSNSLAHALTERFDIHPLVTAVTLMVLVFMVIIGGIKRIGQFASRVVPFMAVAYLLCGLTVLIINFDQIPRALWLIMSGAFGGVDQIAGGAVGYSLALAIRYGVARAMFSNEAGLGSAAIAHACSRAKSPVDQGLIATLGVLIDTILICSMTALVILTTDLWHQRTVGGEPVFTGAVLTLEAFSQSLGSVGGDVTVIALVFFAFTTILGWSVYGEKCLVYLFGTAMQLPFRLIWVLVCPVGALVLLGDQGQVKGIETVWLISDIFNALMAVPNLIALVLLSPVVVTLTRAYFLSNGSSDTSAESQKPLPDKGAL